MSKPITNTFLFFTNRSFSQLNESLFEMAQDAPEDIDGFIRNEKIDGKTPREIYDKCYAILEKTNRTEADCLNVKKLLADAPDQEREPLKKCSDIFEESIFLLAKLRNKMLIVQRRMKEEMEKQKEMHLLKN